jgi:hypothetical protein
MEMDEHDLSMPEGQMECKEMMLFHFEEKKRADEEFNVPEIRFIEPVKRKKKYVVGIGHQEADERAATNLGDLARHRPIRRSRRQFAPVRRQ